MIDQNKQNINFDQILEIMDRSLGPRVGIKVGDLTTITQIFFISVSRSIYQPSNTQLDFFSQQFLLEIGSTFMLFVCNVRGLFARN